MCGAGGGRRGRHHGVLAHRGSGGAGYWRRRRPLRHRARGTLGRCCSGRLLLSELLELQGTTKVARRRARAPEIDLPAAAESLHVYRLTLPVRIEIRFGTADRCIGSDAPPNPDAEGQGLLRGQKDRRRIIGGESSPELAGRSEQLDSSEMPRLWLRGAIQGHSSTEDESRRVVPSFSLLELAPPPSSCSLPPWHPWPPGNPALLATAASEATL